MTKTCYSHNEEDFHSDFETPLEYAVENFLEDNPEFEGETEIEIFEGEKIPKRIGDFTPDVTEWIGELAFEESGEYSEDWVEKIYERRKEIKEIIRAALNKWADENDAHPDFFAIGKVSPLSVKIHIDKDRFWEHVD